MEPRHQFLWFPVSFYPTIKLRFFRFSTIRGFSKFSEIKILTPFSFPLCNCRQRRQSVDKKAIPGASIIY